MTPTRIARDTYGGSKSVDDRFVDGRESGMLPPLGLASAHGNKWYTSQKNKNGISFSMPESGPLPFRVTARRKGEDIISKEQSGPLRSTACWGKIQKKKINPPLPVRRDENGGKTAGASCVAEKRQPTSLAHHARSNARSNSEVISSSSETGATNDPNRDPKGKVGAHHLLSFKGTLGP